MIMHDGDDGIAPVLDAPVVHIDEIDDRPLTLKPFEINILWMKYFEERDMLDELCRLSAGTDRLRMVVDYDDLEAWHLRFAEWVIDNPSAAAETAEVVMRDLLIPEFKEMAPRFGIRNLFAPVYGHDIADLRSKHAFNLVRLCGTAKSVSNSREAITRAAFECPTCHQRLTIVQDWAMPMSFPASCDANDIGGCERRLGKKARLLTKDSERLNYQCIRLSQNPTGDSGRTQSEEITVYAEEDMMGRVNPGDYITVTGPLSLMPTGDGTDVERYVRAMHIDPTDDLRSMNEITLADRKAIALMKDDPTIIENIAQSIAPSLHGLRLEKIALALMLYGGVAIERDDIRVRGDIHILLLGDPGTGKSQIVKTMLRYSPRSMKVSGPAASGPGLTAVVKQVEKGKNSNQWEVEAGALPLCDKGLLIIDEMEKMGKSDQAVLLDALEQQMVTIRKAASVDLVARTSLLAVANPDDGKFNQSRPLPKQVNIQQPLLDRFDAVFPIFDSTKTDKAKTAHMRKVRTLATQQVKLGNSDMASIYGVREIRAHITVAKETITPSIPEDVGAYLDEWWIQQRDNFKDEVQVAMSARMLESLNRFAEAAARCRMDPIVSMDDAMLSINIVEQYLSLYNPSGMALDAYNLGASTKDVRVRQADILDAIRVLEDDGELGKFGAWTVSEIRKVNDLRWNDVQRACEELLATGMLEHASNEQGSPHKRYRRKNRSE